MLPPLPHGKGSGVLEQWQPSSFIKLFLHIAFVLKSLYKVIMLTTMNFNTYKQGIARSEHHRRTSNPHHGMGVS